MIRVLVFSHDVKLQPLLAPALGKEFQVVAEPDAEKFKEWAFGSRYDVLLLDIDSTLGLVEEQVKLYERIAESGTAVVLMADDDARPTALDLVQRGVHGYCRKPPAIRELKALIRRAYDHTVMKRELEARRLGDAEKSAEATSFDGLIGTSAPIKRVCDLVSRVADLNASVLITGESGTGKELIAKAIHNLGNRAKLPFIPVSCGAIPETLIESELFGHEKGAFTGTTGTRMGYFEQAGGGTLFLDEIGELTLLTQVKLLRVLQQREFCRLGSSRTIPLRARVILATHRDLSQMVEEGKFRLDLYYRINVMTIRAPALADHPEDIQLLSTHFLRKYSEMYDKRVKSITPSAMQMLESYDWPGNVRELENAVQGSIIRTDNDCIGPEDLPEHLQDQEFQGQGDYPTTGTFERLLRDYKVKLALRAIEECNGNKTLAARSLDISRAYLHRLIRLAEQVQSIDAA